MIKAIQRFFSKPTPIPAPTPSSNSLAIKPRRKETIYGDYCISLIKPHMRYCYLEDVWIFNVFIVVDGQMIKRLPIKGETPKQAYQNYRQKVNKWL